MIILFPILRCVECLFGIFVAWRKIDRVCVQIHFAGRFQNNDVNGAGFLDCVPVVFGHESHHL